MSRNMDLGSIPQISSTELHSFHEAHFGQAATRNFAATFTIRDGQQDANQGFNNTQEHHTTEADADDDDELGYYPDGTKRTLTDEQIAMFRHSELEALRREKHGKKTKDGRRGRSQQDRAEMANANPSEPGEPPEIEEPARSKNNKGNKKPNTRQPRREPKPDLRKRTWDVVDKGLDSLEYD